MKEKSKLIPNLFVVGEPKCGTTALYSIFKEHPQIFAPDQKELNFFAQDVIKKRFGDKKLSPYFIKTEKDYTNKFHNAKNEKYLLDNSPIYLFSKEAAEKIYKFNPLAKIIALFRNPVDYVHSLHSQLVYSGIETERSFENAINIEQERKDNRSDEYLYYTEWTKYYEHLNRYLKLFPKNQIMIIIYEEFSNNNLKTLNEISDFLSIEKFKFKNYTKTKVNTNKTLRLPLLKRLQYNFPIGILIKKYTKASNYDKLKKIYFGLITRHVERKKISEDLRLKLQNQYRDEVINFEILLKKLHYIPQEFNLLNYWRF